ncbi:MULTISPECIES: methyl-accepting chemotaxis protein [Vibrio]|uniref:Methyl-accepting chemotaxis protein n=1 Tax=bacterium 19MO03SA05 TaxID=2920620 RepID=A0AAU6VIY4_UNCXX|nr:MULTISPECIES: methyl-accepting chemotaxis protein [unclassified Vibrio]EKO3570816.1 methyl-accepting chemotaxis protein [Vibrio metschnikovii]EKO3585388.1 methyl-accepting chemotaxis protein [Vibrio metschnikovii]EKO3922140.1 methyl-accepting chemotaxis protein [Vibrio metschnikovii]ELF5342389.1 methyl-accepting chemotaxis protein [Vibrio metschnikovii]MDQ2108447.1 methyl-accepting chemotaxis protein [Vibrio sp. 2017_1457_15]
MFTFKNMTIKSKVVLGMTLAVLASTTILGLMAQHQARQTLEHRLVDIELPTMLHRIAEQIDRDVSTLLQASQQIANNVFIQEVIATTDRNAEQEAQLVLQLNNIRQQYRLDDASVANRETAFYWNQNGFLRQLNRQQDGWFFGFTDSQQPTMVSMFREPTGEVKLFANYQIVNGISMSGLSKSMDDMVRLLTSFKIEQTGFVYLANAQGEIQVHHQNDKHQRSLSHIYGPQASSLLNKSTFNLMTAQDSGEEVFVASLYIPSMDWFVVASVPVREVFADLNSMGQRMILLTLMVAGGFIVVGIILANSIAKPIRQIAQRFTDLGQGDGDLSQRIEIEGTDEIAQLSQGFNGFIDKIHQSMKEVSATSRALHHAAANVSNKSQTTFDNNQHQREQTVQVVTAMNQMGSTISEIAANAATAAETANEAATSTLQGKKVITQAKNTIDRLATDIMNTGEVVGQLAKKTQDIGSILDVIRDISDQTNLLALNAAIEAARAGDQGRGFAVVADEVRNLASRTASSTEEIQTMIHQLQADAKAAVQAMETGRSVSAEGVEFTQSAAQELEIILLKIRDITDRNTQVATATEEQSTVVYTINSNVEEINVVNEKTTVTAEQLAQASQELSDLSQRLDSMVSNFKL